jgi:plastocyanin
MPLSSLCRWLVLCVAVSVRPSAAQGVGDASVLLHISVQDAVGKVGPPSAESPVVVWLSPIGVDGKINSSPRPGLGKSLQMVQKDKMFAPHLLVVPTGTVVAFPNRDPFFHNVFSLFNGRRFDLGLYETGSSHSVPFNREGISYIFCNIHPEMGAIIVSVATPYFSVADHAQAQLQQVPRGDYQLNVWAEEATPASLSRASRRIHIEGPSFDAGDIEVILQPKSAHTNKFGQPYSKQRENDSPY